MLNTNIRSPLLVLLGETSSGKSALAIDLAEQFNGEIICADSRTIYRGLNIGTAKPSIADRVRIPHYGLDLVLPNEKFTAADFKVYAVSAIEDIANRDKLPIMVGGTGLYIDAVIYNYQFRRPATSQLRRQLESLSVPALQQRLHDKRIALPKNANNPRHLIRALETLGELSSRSALRSNTLVLGLQIDKDVLQDRIVRRVENMVEAGVVTEATELGTKYGWDCAALQTTSYKAIRGYVLGTQTLTEAEAEFVRNDMNLAKRQRTWFKRNKSIQWLATEYKLSEAVDIATTFLNK